MSKLKKNQSGFGHIEVLILIVVVGAAGFGAWRVATKDDTQSDIRASISTQEALPENLTSLKSLDEIGQVAGVSAGVPIISFVLEDKDGFFVYDIVLSNGKKFSINASTGEIITEETTDVADSDKLPEGFVVSISPSQAYDIASSKSDSRVKSIELEVEDDKVTYKIELKDGSKVEINAGNGEIVKSEIKDEASNENEEEDEDEPEDEDDENEELEDEDENEFEEKDEDDENESNN